MKKLNKETTVAVILGDDRESAYRKLINDRLGLSGIPKCLKPQKNIWTGEITITNPKGHMEVWKEENSLVGKKYKRIR